LLVNFTETPGVVQRGPAMCGEHTRELLREVGYRDAEIDALTAARAVLE
jgi:crotonobetainyl-CoA:carnitine CoA-transferase CaiB-like acyl-CoA transferase